jgi:phenylacetic acid degradation operon negative regulatory protein
VARRTTVEIPTRTLVLGMAHEDGTLLASEIYPVAEACGQSPEQVRSCLRRLVTEGLFIRTGAGRTASFAATPDGRAALAATTHRTRLAWSQDVAGRGWDGQWRLVAFAVPETRRAARDALRDQVRMMGGASLQGGLYVSPHPWHDDVRAAADRLGIRDGITLATATDLDVDGERDPRVIARRLWPIDDLARRYERFVADYRWVPEALGKMRDRHERLPDADFLPGGLAMAVAFGTSFNDDPLLPPELLPRPWPGRAARDLLVRSRRGALALRQAAGRPALFRMFDETVAEI